MKVLFDLLPLAYTYKSGVFTYAKRILFAWYKMGINDVVVLTYDSYVKELQANCPSYQVITIEYKEKFSSYSKKALYYAHLRNAAITKSKCDILFNPMPEPYFLTTPSIPKVMVIHDTAFSRQKWFQINILLHLQLLNCNKIITISKYSSECLLQKFPLLNPDKVKVIYNGISYSVNNYQRMIDKRYILCVNALSKYKNADTLVSAFGKIKDKVNCDLILVGIDENGRKTELESLAKKNNCKERFRILQNLPDNELISLYQNASLFVSPSTMEGFGQTPIEAAIYKCPVLTSMETALPESTAGMVNYYKPVYSSESLAEKMLDILTNPPSEETLTNISNSFKTLYDVGSQSKKIYKLLESSFNK